MKINMAGRKRKLKPMELPRSTLGVGRKLIRPLGRDEATANLGGANLPFRRDDNEQWLLSMYAQQQIQILGADVDFYSQCIEQSTRDPVYDEPTERVFRGPFKVRAWVSWASSSPVVGEDGIRVAFKTQCWIPRLELERVGAPAPFEGDIIRFWDTPFFNSASTAGSGDTNSGYFFDITNADNDGHINDSPSFTGFKLDLARSTEFGAERRILPP